ncbi:MAG: haloacid dehalogenase type II [Dongiaceae bacterium]
MPEPRLAPIDACVFDAYGTLFDVNSAAARCRAALGNEADAFSATWRRKQLEYSWLRSLMGTYADFWQITGDALDYACERHGIGDPETRARLLESYRQLNAYPEVGDMLTAIRAVGLKTAILSNGAPAMLQSAIDSAGIGGLLDQVLSVAAVGIYKPHPQVYRLAVDGLGVAANRICFLSANGWDIAGAAQFGFRAVWINRGSEPRERLPAGPALELRDLGRLPRIVHRS